MVQFRKLVSKRDNLVLSHINVWHIFIFPLQEESDESGESGRDVSFDEAMQGPH